MDNENMSGIEATKLLRLGGTHLAIVSCLRSMRGGKIDMGTLFDQLKDIRFQTIVDSLIDLEKLDVFDVEITINTHEKWMINP